LSVLELKLVKIKNLILNLRIMLIRSKNNYNKPIIKIIQYSILKFENNKYLI